MKFPNGSQVILDVHNDMILVNQKTFFKQDTLAIGKLPRKGFENAIVWKELTESHVVEGSEKFTYSYIDITHNNDDDVSK